MTPEPSHTPCSQWVGLDVGGANLKGADLHGHAESRPFALWRESQRLPEALSELLSAFDPNCSIALTMTGELADCYADKAEGVRHIVQATTAAAPDRTVVVATVDDDWLSPSEACEQPLRVAAANWRVLARAVAKRMGDQSALLADAGSTTVDLIPVRNGTVDTASRTDLDRLLAGELVYTGVRRTPVCALVDSLPYREKQCPVAAELFATTADAWLLLGELHDSHDAETADGRPLTRDAAVARLARCCCLDSSHFSLEDAIIAAKAIAGVQVQRLAELIDGQQTVVVSGEGGFLIRRAAQQIESSIELISLHKLFRVDEQAAISACAPAYAAALLAQEEAGR